VLYLTPPAGADACVCLLPTLHCGPPQLVRYRCRKCRQVVATERHVIPQEGVGRRAFRRQHHHQQQQERQEQQQADSAAADGSTEQGAIFLEPMQWMSDQVCVACVRTRAARSTPIDGCAHVAHRLCRAAHCPAGLALHTHLPPSNQIVGPTQGKLYCRQCTARLGSFNWAGADRAGFDRVGGSGHQSARVV
jgi:hypothetical protein